jgi:hypothetical protein
MVMVSKTATYFHELMVIRQMTTGDTPNELGFVRQTNSVVTPNELGLNAKRDRFNVVTARTQNVLQKVTLYLYVPGLTVEVVGWE